MDTQRGILLLVLALAVLATFLPLAQAVAQTTPSDGGYGTTTDNDHGFNPGLIGLVGLFGLLGLRHKREREEPYRRSEPQSSRA